MTHSRPDYAARSRTRKPAKGPGRIGSAFHATASTVLPPQCRTFTAVDPGFTKGGLAEFRNITPLMDFESWVCIKAWKPKPMELIEWVIEAMRTRDIVMEEYRLYPWSMEQQGFSSLGTPEVIGVIRYAHWKQVQEGLTFALVLQGAHVMKPAETILGREGIKLIGKNKDARAAELHGWWAIHNMTNPAARRRANQRAQQRLMRGGDQE